MSCAPIDTEAPRFRVITVEGYPITLSGTTDGKATPELSATVLDGYYGSEHGRYGSRDRFVGGSWHSPKEWQRSGGRVRGRAGALAAAAERCAELNAWHEREGWEQA